MAMQKSNSKNETKRKTRKQKNANRKSVLSLSTVGRNNEIQAYLPSPRVAIPRSTGAVDELPSKPNTAVTTLVIHLLPPGIHLPTKAVYFVSPTLKKHIAKIFLQYNKTIMVSSKRGNNKS